MLRSIPMLMAAVLVLSAPLAAQCAATWSGQFGNTSVQAFCALAHDDGSGLALYFGEYSGMVRWRGPGTPFERVGGAGAPFQVADLAVWNDGQGPALYATGYFTMAGGVSVNRIAKWNGSTWSALGTGLGGGSGSALAVYDDGSGAALYAAGSFTTAGGVPAAKVAKWNGSTWTAVATSIANSLTTGSVWVTALEVYDPGTGPRLYATGNFTAINGVPAVSIASFDGSTWAPLGSGLLHGTFPAGVSDLEVYDDGTGPRLYVGGLFNIAGGVAVSNVTRWNGATFDAMNGGVGVGPGNAYGSVNTLAKWNTPTGQKLVVGGEFDYVGTHPTRVALWNGGWQSGHAPDRTPYVAVAHDFGGGEVLYISGEIQSNYPSSSYTPSTSYDYLQAYDGATWSAPTGDGLIAVQANGNDIVLASHDDGSGAKLYASGGLIAGSGVSLAGIGTWDGSSWAPVGNTAMFAKTMVSAGGQLYVTEFSTSWTNVQRWNGVNWTNVGMPINGVNGAIITMVRADTPSGPVLLVGGTFTSAGGMPANRVAVLNLNTSTWSALGAGIGNGAVHALEVFDDGTGPAYYAAGTFTFSGSTFGVNSIAKWNGSQWLPLGSGIEGPSGMVVQALEVFDDGSGPALYAAGIFSTAGGVATTNVARWNGTSWSPVGAGIPGGGAYEPVRVLLAFEQRLYAAGEFYGSAAFPTSGIARWDGLAWSPVDGGIGGLGWGVTGLARYDAGNGPSLFAAGIFNMAGGKPSVNFAELIVARPKVTLSQLGGPGSGLVVANASLIPGLKHFNIFSVEPAPLGPGTGPYFGLFATNPAVLFAQLVPGFAPPFHFAATSTTTAFGPYPVPSGAVIEAVCFEYTNDHLGCVSVNPHFTVQ